MGCSLLFYGCCYGGFCVVVVRVGRGVWEEDGDEGDGGDSRC